MSTQEFFEEKFIDALLGYLAYDIKSRLEIPLFRTKEGKYLAKSLGDPLLKGLTEIVENQPPNPVEYLATYLQNYVKPETSRPETAQSTNNDSIINNLTSQKLIFKNNEESNSSPERAETPIITEDRDEHGQSMLHFASARSQPAGSLLNLIEDSKIDITYRDELYRTARDVSFQASEPENAKEIDRFVFSLVVKGDLQALKKMVLNGYDHILDLQDDNDNNIIKVAQDNNHQELLHFLENLASFEEIREEFHQSIRDGNIIQVKEILSLNDPKSLIRAKNYYGRHALHIAILTENEEIIEYLIEKCKYAIKIGDNLEKTPLHYAMALKNVESLSRVLIKNGAKRVVKDLKGRQPSYYFINKTDILRIRDEEQTNDQVELSN